MNTRLNWFSLVLIIIVVTVAYQLTINTQPTESQSTIADTPETQTDIVTVTGTYTPHCTDTIVVNEATITVQHDCSGYDSTIRANGDDTISLIIDNTEYPLIEETLIIDLR